jgi:hypothetical protein
MKGSITELALRNAYPPLSDHGFHTRNHYSPGTMRVAYDMNMTSLRKAIKGSHHNNAPIVSISVV